MGCTPEEVWGGMGTNLRESYDSLTTAWELIWGCVNQTQILREELLGLHLTALRNEIDDYRRHVFALVTLHDGPEMLTVRKDRK